MQERPLSQMIAGVIEPTDGELNVLVGEDWVDMTKPGFDLRGRAKQYIGLLHQEYDLFPHRTILDNLTDAIGLEFPKELAMRKAIITLKMAGFTQEKARDVLERLPPTLSEGERQSCSCPGSYPRTSYYCAGRTYRNDGSDYQG